jgi:prepilin-type N-terminal cleavage/methylation domain-containing protein
MKKIRQGFSMIELLFVMVIMAALAAIAIPNLSSGTDSAVLTSMRSDAQAAYSVAQASYVDNLDFSAVAEANNDTVTFTDTDNDGLADTGGANNDGKIGEARIVISDGNKIEMTRTDDCGDGTKGVSIDVTNPQIEDKKNHFNSCTDGKFKLIDD